MSKNIPKVFGTNVKMEEPPKFRYFKLVPEDDTSILLVIVNEEGDEDQRVLRLVMNHHGKITAQTIGGVSPEMFELEGSAINIAKGTFGNTTKIRSF